MNYRQNAIFEVIKGILSVPDVKEYMADSVIRYGFLNYIAKFSLSNDRYFVTEKSYEFLEKKEYLVNGTLKRSKKSQRNGFTFEHPVPANQIGRIILEAANPIETAREVLLATDCVTVLTRDEDDILSSHFRSKMPEGWNWKSDSVFARYLASGLLTTPPNSTIVMEGSIVR